MHFKFSKFLLLFFTISLIFSSFSWSQNSIYFEHLSLKEGLSQGDVNAIYQDKKGFLWFGTHDGLNKFDGYNFTVFKPEKGNSETLNSNLIYSITGDKDDNLWIGTTGKGINYFDKKKGVFKHIVHDKNNPSSLSSNHINHILIDKEQRLWVATRNGLNVANLKNHTIDSLKFNHYSLLNEKVNNSLNKHKVNCIYQDKQNQIWVGSSHGLFLLSRDSMGGIYFKCVNEQIKLPKTIVNCITEDQFGKLIIATSKGLFVYKSFSDVTIAKQISFEFVHVVTTDKENNIWSGGNNGLKFYINPHKNRNPEFKYHYTYKYAEEKGLSKNVIKSLFVDKTEIVWIGTQAGGINKTDPMKKGFKIVKNTTNIKSLSYDNIRSFYEDENSNLWIGTNGEGLNIALKGKRYDEFIKLKTFRKCFDIEKIASQNKILFGAEASPGLYELDLSKIKNLKSIKDSDIKPVFEIKNSVFTILEDSNKTIWIGTYGGGIHRWIKNPENNTYKKDIIIFNESNKNSIPSNIIRKIFEDSQHNIWIGTADGLCKITNSETLLRDPQFITYKNLENDSSSISHNYILDILETSTNELWVGTLGGGINKLTTPLNTIDAKFVNYTEKNGLANNVIKGILEDNEKNIWISSNKGLSMYHVNKNRFKNYDVNDGLQSNEFQELACIKRKSGELLFGGTNGFNYFNPKNIKNNTYKANAIVTNFYVSNQAVKRGQKLNTRVIYKDPIDETKYIELNHDENSISFEFSALHFSSPKKNVFAYKLDGFDKNWIYTESNKRFATYTNLEAGKYTFKVKAANNSGMWEQSHRELVIKITPPFWKTIYAYFFYVFIFSLLLFLIWKKISDKTKTKHWLELETIEKNKQEELQNLKLEFFTNISHEFRTPLTLIKGPIDFLQKKELHSLKQETYDEQLRLIKKNSDYLLRLVNQLLDFRKMNQGKTTLVMRNSDIVNFIREVCEPFQFLVHKKNINFTLHSSTNTIHSWFDHDALEKVINNLLSNAYKFTPKNGEIDLYVSEQNNQVVIKVIDSGIGISKNQMNNIFERYYTKKNKKQNNPTGIGIGLAFTKNLVELHQGKIQVISTKNKGSEFVISIPMHKQAYLGIPEILCKTNNENDFEIRTSETEALAIDISDDITDQNISKNRSNELPVLLVVDDNEDIRNFIKYSLEDQYKIYEAENGLEGFELAIKIIPNIIITDLIMHVMDGMELCKKLKTTITTSHIPVLILSAKKSQENEILGLKNGADDYIRKPFDIELLELKLKNIIQKRQLLRKGFKREINLETKEFTVTSSDERFLKQVIKIIDKHMSNTEFSVEMLVNEIGQSRSNLYIKLKEITGLSSSEFIRSIRLKRAMQLFDTTNLPVKEVMYKTGFSTASYFSKCFKKQFGAKPSDYLNSKKNGPKNNSISIDDMLDDK